jgi:hypothetical protein
MNGHLSLNTLVVDLKIRNEDFRGPHLPVCPNAAPENLKIRDEKPGIVRGNIFAKLVNYLLMLEIFSIFAYFVFHVQLNILIISLWLSLLESLIRSYRWLVRYFRERREPDPRELFTSV